MGLFGQSERARLQPADFLLGPQSAAKALTLGHVVLLGFGDAAPAWVQNLPPRRYFLAVPCSIVRAAARSLRLRRGAQCNAVHTGNHVHTIFEIRCVHPRSNIPDISSGASKTRDSLRLLERVVWCISQIARSRISCDLLELHKFLKLLIPSS